jgi:5'-3' exonuclease
MIRPRYLVDASIYIFRAYFSLPERWHSPQGYPLNAVYGYTSFLAELLEQLGPGADLAAAFDESLGSCFRNEIFPGYKASRELPDEALAFQLDACRQVTERLGIPCYGGSSHEADDYIATLAVLSRDRGQPVIVITRDKDLGQLLDSEGDRLWDYAGGTHLDRAGFLARFGVEPSQFPDYQGLVGDAIDDIPGVPSIGARSGARLIGHFGDLETLAQNLDDLDGLGLRGAARIRAALEEHWDTALMSRELARLDSAIADVALPGPWNPVQEQFQALDDYLDDIALGGALRGRLRRLAAGLGQGA